MGFGKPQTGRGSTGNDVMMNRKCMEMGGHVILGGKPQPGRGKGDRGLRSKTRDAMLKQGHFFNPNFMLQAGTWTPEP